MAPSDSATTPKASGEAIQLRTPSGVLLASHAARTVGSRWWSSMQDSAMDRRMTAHAASASAGIAVRTSGVIATRLPGASVYRAATEAIPSGRQGISEIERDPTPQSFGATRELALPLNGDTRESGVGRRRVQRHISRSATSWRRQRARSRAHAWLPNIEAGYARPRPTHGALRAHRRRRRHRYRIAAAAIR